MKTPERPRLVAAPEDGWGHELFQEALKLLRAPDNQDAAPLIRSVIQMFKDDIEQERAAPRISDLKKKLRKISQHSRGLARLLDEVDPYFLRAMNAYTFTDDWPWGRDRGGFDQHGRNEFLHPLVSKSTQLKTMLSGIRKGADLVVEKMPTDIGSRGNLFDILHQSPKQLLTIRCWELFWQFRPGDARGTPEHDFHNFCGILYHLSTGEGPEEEGVGLLRYVKKAAKVCNEFIDRNPKIDNLRRILADGDSTLGLISDTGLAAALLGSPQHLMNRSAKKPEKHEN